MVKYLRKEPKPRHLRVKLGLLDTSRSTWSFGFNPGNPKQDSNSSMVGLYAMVHQVACQLHALTKILEETLYSHHMKLLHVAPRHHFLRQRVCRISCDLQNGLGMRERKVENENGKRVSIGVGLGIV